MNKGEDLSRAILYSVSGGVVAATFGLLGTPPAQAEPKNTAGVPTGEATPAGSSNAADRRQANVDKQKAISSPKKPGNNSGSQAAAERNREKAEATQKAKHQEEGARSERAAERHRENAEKKEEEGTKEGSKQPSGSANAAEKRQENAEKKQAKAAKKKQTEKRKGETSRLPATAAATKGKTLTTSAIKAADVPQSHIATIKPASDPEPDPDPPCLLGQRSSSGDCDDNLSGDSDGPGDFDPEIVEVLPRLSGGGIPLGRWFSPPAAPPAPPAPGTSPGKPGNGPPPPPPAPGTNPSKPDDKSQQPQPAPGTNPGKPGNGPPPPPPAPGTNPSKPDDKSQQPEPASPTVPATGGKPTAGTGTAGNSPRPAPSTQPRVGGRGGERSGKADRDSSRRQQDSRSGDTERDRSTTTPRPRDKVASSSSRRSSTAGPSRSDRDRTAETTNRNHVQSSAGTPHRSHNEPPSVTAARRELPPPVARNSGAKTHGRWTTSDQPDRLVPIVSGKRDEMYAETERYLEAMGLKGYAIASHAETKLAVYMARTGLRNATVTINNTPCTGDKSCDTWLRRILPPGAWLTVYGTREDGTPTVQTYLGRRK